MWEPAESFYLHASKMIIRYGLHAISLSLIHTETSSMEERRGYSKIKKNNQGLYSSACIEPPIRMHYQRKPAGGAVLPDAWRGESSYMRPDPLVMWPPAAETLTHTHLLPLTLFSSLSSLTEPPSQTQSQRQWLQKEGSVHTMRRGFGLYQGHPPGKHMKIRWLTNTRQIRFTTIHVQKGKTSLTQQKINNNQTYAGLRLQSHSTGCMTSLQRSPGYSNCCPHSPAPRQPQQCWGLPIMSRSVQPCSLPSRECQAYSAGLVGSN